MITNDFHDSLFESICKMVSHMLNVIIVIKDGKTEAKVKDQQKISKGKGLAKEKQRKRNNN